MPSYSPDQINVAGTAYLESVKKRSRIEWIMHVLAFACAVAAVTASETMAAGSPQRLQLLVATGFAAGVFEYLGWRFRRHNERTFAAARRLRRLGIASDGLGIPWLTEKPDDMETMHVQGRSVGAGADEYFASDHDEGWLRVMDHVQESAFFSWKLYQSSTFLVQIAIALFFGAVAGVTFVAFHHAASLAHVVLIAQWTLVISSFAAGSGLLDQYARWRQAAIECAHVVATADDIKHMASSMSDMESQFRVLGIYSDYAAATLGAPPPPSWLYLKNRKKLTISHALRYAAEWRKS